MYKNQNIKNVLLTTVVMFIVGFTLIYLLALLFNDAVALSKIFSITMFYCLGFNLGNLHHGRNVIIELSNESNEMNKLRRFLELKGQLVESNNNKSIYKSSHPSFILKVYFLVDVKETTEVEISKSLWKHIQKKY